MISQYNGHTSCDTSRSGHYRTAQWITFVGLLACLCISPAQAQQYLYGSSSNQDLYSIGNTSNNQTGASDQSAAASAINQSANSNSLNSPLIGGSQPQTPPVSINLVNGAGANPAAAVAAMQTQRAGAIEREIVTARSEFEEYVTRRVGVTLPRYGASLLTQESRDFSLPATSTIPGAYELNPGDTVSIQTVGLFWVNDEFTINSDGDIFIPKVGKVNLVGVRYDQLQATLVRAIGQRYKNVDVSVHIKKLNGIRVYVTGFAAQPGSYSLNSLSTLVTAVLAAGGPAAGGSFRSIKLYRKNKLISDFDLYDLLRNGDRSKDVLLQNEDVLVIPPVGTQVAITGSVNSAAIYEAKVGESLGHLLKTAAGGVNSLADSEKFLVYRFKDLDHNGSITVKSTEADTVMAEAGDIIQVLSIGAPRRPIEKQAILVRLEGEVAKPGDYYVPPNTPLATVLEQAGGLTQRAFVYGTRLERLSVREQQRQSYREAIDQIQMSLTAAPLSSASPLEAGMKEAQLKAAKDVVDQLKSQEPDGRVVLNLKPNSTQLPGDFVLENNDRIYVPPVPSTVGVFGNVYRPGSFEFTRGEKISVYLKYAGGPQDTANKKGVFVVHANGEVTSKNDGSLSKEALPGDLIFVPIKTENVSSFARIGSISSFLAGLGLSIAAIHAVFP